MENFVDVRPSALAGRWYPANPKQLAESVDSFIDQATIPVIPGEIIALISPHAGHIYSGPVAGYCFAAIRNTNPDLVVILSPYHQFHTDAILTTSHQAYQTPLGNVAVDLESIQEIDSELKERAGIHLKKIKNDDEHAIEILLPFFQRALSEEFKILPLMLRPQDLELMKSLSSILAELFNQKKVLLTASTDLSHFFPAEKATKLDQTIINHIKTLDPEGLYQAQDQGQGSACGLGAIAAVIWATKEGGSVTAHHLNYSHSGDITGDLASVVGYTAAAITRDQPL